MPTKMLFCGHFPSSLLAITVTSSLEINNYRSLYLVQIQISADSVWEAVLTDLEKIEDTKMDVSLYTADASFLSNCSIPVRRCFIDEMQVIMYESQLGNNITMYNIINTIIRLINDTLKGTQAALSDFSPLIVIQKLQFPIKEGILGSNLKSIGNIQ